MSKLAGLGIQVSRSQEPEAGVNSRLSGLGVSVSGGPRPVASSSPRLPPGIAVSGGPTRPSLPPGISMSGGPVKTLPPGVSISGGQRPSLPPGVSISGGHARPQSPNGAGSSENSARPPNGGQRPSPGARPNLPPGVSISGGQARPQPPNGAGPRGPRPNLPPGVSVSSENGGQRPSLGPRPGLPSGVSINSSQRQPSPRPSLPPGISVNQESSQRPQATNGAPRPNLPPGISVNSDSSKRLSEPADTPKQTPPRPNIPSGISINSASSPRLAAPNNGAALRPNLPPGLSANSAPRPTGVNGQGGAPGVKTQAPPVQSPDQSPAPDDKEPDTSERRSESPAETMSMIAGFVKETEEEKDDSCEPESEMETEKTGGDQPEEARAGAEQAEPLSEPKPAAEESTDITQQEISEENVENNKEKDGSENVPTSSDETQEQEESGASKAKEGEKEVENDDTAAGSLAVVNGEEKDKSEPKDAGDEAEEENWEEYDEYDGDDAYEGYEGYEGEEDYEGYEGEEGWEGYEEEGAETGEKTDEKVGEKEKGTTEEKPAEEPTVNGDVSEGETNEKSMDFDDDGAPKHPEEGQKEDEESPATPVSTGSRQSQDEHRSSKIPAGISMSPVPNLPPGISISSPSGKGPGSVSAAPPNLPPGISISPFKKPSTSSRMSVDDDARSQDSRDLEDGLPDSVSIRSFREGEAPDPLVGTDTECVFCRERCSNNNPRLLTCLMSSCASCFSRKIKESIRDNSANDVVDLDGNDIQMAPEVTCTVCKATTSEDEVMDNVFAVTDPGEEESQSGEEAKMCNSCEENSVATHYCEDNEEFLCSDCVRAYGRVKMTKDFKFRELQVSGQSASLAHLNYCPIHRNEKLTLYCETCDKLNCRDCQLSEQCRDHRYRYSYEVAPEVKAHLMQTIGDIKLKRSGLEESRQILSSRISDINARENSMMSQMTEIKNKMVAKIESRHKELCTEISKICREKRKIVEGRKSTLDRTFWQADYSINFVDHLLSTSVSDEKILLTKRMLYRQMKRMRRANNAVGLTPPEMELQLDLYFQHFSNTALHTNLDNVLKMVMSDIKVSQVPIEAPKPKPPPQPAQPPPQPSPVRQPPVTPNRALPGSPHARLSSPARLNAGMVSRQLATPTKKQQVVVRGSPLRGSPRGGQIANRGMVMTRGGQRVMQQQPQMRGRVGMVVTGGRGQVQMIRGQQMGRGGQMMQTRGRGVVRGGAMMTRGQPRMTQVTPTKRGGMMGGRGQTVMRPVMRGGVQQRGQVQMMRGQQMMRPRLQQPQPARRGRPPASAVMMNPEPLVYNQRQPAQRTIVQNQQPRKIQARPVSPSPSWHTPSAQNRPVSPPKTNDNFKIKLPTMGKMPGPGGAGGKVKVENVNLEDDDDIISIDASPVKMMRPSDPLSSLNRPGLQISRGKSNSDEGVDPLSLDNVSRSHLFLIKLKYVLSGTSSTNG